MLLEIMSSALQLPERYISGIAETASHRYKEYSIPKSGGGSRTIHHPSRELKALQRWLLSNIVDRLPAHDAAMAYRKGRTIAQNAARHAGSSFLLRMDFADFFPSLTWEDIGHHLGEFRDTLPNDWKDEDSELFCSLVCRNRALTIGAVTSPALSNTLLYGLDIKLTSLAGEEEIIYTRYADDLYFSTDRRDALRGFESIVPSALEGLAYPRLVLNRGKTYHSSKKHRRIVTGLVLTSDGGVSIGRSRKRRLRSLVHNWGNLDEDERIRLAGWLAYAKSVEPDFLNRLILKYGHEKVATALTPYTEMG